MFWRRKAPLRYFLYISDAKLDMLFEQIDPAQRRRVSMELGLDLKLASVVLRQGDPPRTARLAKLRIVERYIDRHHQVGTGVQPGAAFFRGSMPMRWGWLSNGYEPESPTNGFDTVFFRGQDANGIVMLAGSRRHVLGEEPTEENQRLVAYSATPNIMAVIAENLSARPDLAEDWRLLRADADIGNEAAMAVLGHPEDGLHDATRIRLSGPSQDLEYLAVPLIQGEVPNDAQPSRHTRAILATPLYVAVAAEMSRRRPRRPPRP
ncbi:DUF7019 family protein [Glycomyces terrestris]|uniref:Uncharacterized protein n=1 Tax=Glycomyces terrestris TaxID=2493553 RepID=A0A426UXJ2_9ACTN|nr:SAVMC3_10250 family protein [Glycomyces terrestris]RRR99200.1 hypothetical protein EIW28_10705 [Glycomyces terrestris]